MVTIDSLVVHLSQFWTSLLFHVRLQPLLLDLNTSFSGDRSVWYSHLSRIFQFIVIHTIKGFNTVNETEVDVFLKFLCFFSIIQWILAIWSLVPLPIWNPACTSERSWFTYYWSLGWRILKHNLTSLWNDHNCMVVWTIFVTVLLWDWNEKWPFPVIWPLLSFENLLTYWVQHFNSIIF